MTRPIYIAASSKELTRAESAIACAREQGLTITRDWTKDVREWESRGGDAGLSNAERMEIAQRNFDGVIRAKVVWFLAPLEHGSTGAGFEFGLAHAYGKPLIVSGPQTLFAAFAVVDVREDDSGLRHVLAAFEAIERKRRY